MSPLTADSHQYRGTMAENLDEIRNKINQMHAKLKESTYYELLEVHPDRLDEKTVLQQFRLKARDWHADRFSAVELDAGLRRKVQEIFAALNTAQQTLSNADKRADYDFKLQAGDQNIENIIDAEGAFRRGKNMLQTGSYKGAHEQFKRAVELHPDETEYKAHYLYTEYLQIPKNDAGVTQNRPRTNEIRKALDEISAAKPEDDAVLTFLGVVCLGLEQQSKAKNLFNEALQHNPRNVEAKRQVRLIAMREERGKKEGFLDKFLARFRS
jgi:tetratricopeptide (TPR) repeat protein